MMFYELMINKMKEEIKKIVKILNSGGVILYPTDTLWGIGCDATNESAVQRIYELKRRSDSKSLLVLTDDITKIERVVDEVPEIAYQLVEVSEKPLTIVYPKGKNLASNLLAEDGSVGIRVTKEIFSKSLCEAFRRPIVSTSANISGETTPFSFQEISKEILEGVDYVVEYGRNLPCAEKASSIMKLEVDGSFKIIRE